MTHDSSASPSATPSSPSVDALILKRAGVVTALVGVVGIVIGTVAFGGPGAIGGIFATALVIVFFSVGQFVLGSVLRSNPQMAMTVALTIYLVKIGVLFVLIIAFAETTLFNTRVFAGTIVACTVAWTIAEVWVFARTKVLYVDPEAGS
jgi:ATP synthase protein I